MKKSAFRTRIAYRRCVRMHGPLVFTYICIMILLLFQSVCVLYIYMLLHMMWCYNKELPKGGQENRISSTMQTVYMYIHKYLGMAIYSSFVRHRNEITNSAGVCHLILLYGHRKQLSHNAFFLCLQYNARLSAVYETIPFYPIG